jgi:YbgC/YbaW family acyl-CoA thioester hydrolase
MKKHHAQRRIEFADTDMGGIVHYARYLVFMETVEHEFLANLGVNVVSELNGRRILWPRVAAKLEYKTPARFGDVLDLHLELMRVGRKSLTFRCRIAVEDREIASGEWTTVCCELEPGRPVRSISIPPHILDKIQNL